MNRFGIWTQSWTPSRISTWIRVLTALVVVAPASLLLSASDSKAPAPSGDLLSGGQTTVFDASHNAYGRAVANLEPIHWPLMREGKRLFVRHWQPGSTDNGGLGPLFVADSCQSCHFKDGRGGVPEETVGDPLAPRTPTPAPLVYRLSQKDPTLTGTWRGDSRHGLQLQTQAIAGAHPEGRVQITSEKLFATYGDGTPIELSSPRYQVVMATGQPLDESTGLSPRIPPSLVGMGLLEAADPREILEWEDPTDTNGDGISGRASWVATVEGLQLGRFGWKAGQATLRAQAIAALAEDIGIVEQEISADEIAHLTLYLQLLAPPAHRNQKDPTVAAGREVFSSLSCDQCHRPTLSTLGANTIPGPRELANQLIRPYTDLLLHDLGPDLADDMGEGSLVGSATGSEWRTAPLWGLGLLETVSGERRLLHDGRARTFEEAILWHGGEAEKSRQSFMELPADERAALLSFLRSL